MSTANDLNQQAPTEVQQTPTEVDWIIEELDAAKGVIPEDAIHAAREHRDVVVPMLIQAIRRAADEARDGHPPEGNAHFFALFLLTEFEAKESLPTILDAMGLPGDLPETLFGDGVGSTLTRTLAALADDTPEVIHELIADRTIASRVRWAAADSFAYLIRDGKIARDEVVEHLRNYLRNAIENKDLDSVFSMVWTLDDLGPTEAMEEIKEAFHLDFVDQFMIDMPSIEQSIQKGEDRIRETLDRCPPTGIADTIEELSTWASFMEDGEDWVEPEAFWGPPSPEDLADAGIIHFSSRPDPGWNDGMRPEDPPEPVGTIRNTQKRVGRNEPCPCGSGKKYKKCCLGS